MAPFKHMSDSLKIWAGGKTFATGGLFQQVAPVEQYWFVLDSSTIQRDLRYLARNASRIKTQNLRTAIQETIDAGVLVGLVPPEAIAEIEKYLPRIAADVCVDVEAMTRIWRDYRRRLTVLVPTRDHHHAVLEKRDPKDLPFVGVLNEAAADALLTADRDLLDTIEAAMTARELMNLLREYVRHKAVAFGSSGQLYAGTFVIGISGSYFARTATSALALARRLPPWVQAALLLGGLYAAQRPEVKAWATRTFARLSRFARFAIPRVLEIAEDAAVAEKAAVNARSEIEKRVRRAKRLGLRAAVLRALRDELTGVAASEVATRILALGYKTKSTRLAAYLERQLKRDPLFERVPSGWRLAGRSR